MKIKEINKLNNEIKSILNANKDQDYGTLSVSSTGLMELQFYSKNIKSEYYMVRKSEENF